MKTGDTICVRMAPADPWVERTLVAPSIFGFLCVPDEDDTHPSSWAFGTELPTEKERTSHTPTPREAYAPFTSSTFPSCRTLIRSPKLQEHSYDVVTGVRSNGVSHGKSDERIPFHKLLDRWDISTDDGATWRPAGQL